MKFAAPGQSSRRPVPVRGRYVDSCTIGSMVLVSTIEDTGVTHLYVVHSAWIPVIDDIMAARVRELYATGDYSEDEIGRMFDIAQQTVHDCVSGADRWRGLPKIVRPVLRRPRA